MMCDNTCNRYIAHVHETWEELLAMHCEVKIFPNHNEKYGCE